jgi:hypothetical protein
MEQPAGPPRRQDIEALRLLSAFGIVWFHTGQAGGRVAYAGLIAFLSLSLLLGGRRGRPDAATLRHRTRRLLLPWGIWFTVYGLWNRSQGLPVLPVDLAPVGAVLAGPSIHLWYLPFLFACLAGLDVLRARLPPARLSTTAGLLAAAVTASAPWWRPVTLGLPYPLLQWADAAAPVLLGVFLLGSDRLAPGLKRTIAGLNLLVAAAVVPFDWIGLPLLLGQAAVLLIDSGRTSAWVRCDLTAWSGATFGVYLCHSLVFALLLQWGALPPALLPWAIFGGALAVAMSVRAFVPAVARLAL